MPCDFPSSAVAIALPLTTRLSCCVSGGDLVSVMKMGPTSYVPLAHIVTLEPRLVLARAIVS